MTNSDRRLARMERALQGVTRSLSRIENCLAYMEQTVATLHEAMQADMGSVAQQQKSASPTFEVLNKNRT